MTAGLMIGVESSVAGVHAALLEGDRVLASASATEGATRPQRFVTALRELVAAEPDARRARGVAVATDRFEAALENRSDLTRIGCVRLAASTDDAVPPLFGWPSDLLRAVGGKGFVLLGGCGYDGRTLGAPSSEGLGALAEQLTADGVGAIAVTAAFGPVDAAVEGEVGAALAALLPGRPIALSHSLGSIGLLDRENATAINAALLPLAARATAELEEATAQVLPGTRAYLTRLDGTVMELPFARRFPVLALGSVLASRLRGLARLAGHADCLIAGRTEGHRWLAVVRGGEPSRSPRGLVVADVGTSLAGLDVIPVEAGEQAWTLATHATGWTEAPWVGSEDDPDLPAPAPPGARYAGAVGAAGTRIAGVVDRILPGGPTRDSGATDAARHRATEQAIVAGAVEGSVEVTEVEEIPLAYVPGNLVRLRVVATGELP